MTTSRHCSTTWPLASFLTLSLRLIPDLASISHFDHFDHLVVTLYLVVISYWFASGVGAEGAEPPIEVLSVPSL